MTVTNVTTFICKIARDSSSAFIVTTTIWQLYFLTIHGTQSSSSTNDVVALVAWFILSHFFFYLFPVLVQVWTTTNKTPLVSGCWFSRLISPINFSLEQLGRFYETFLEIRLLGEGIMQWTRLHFQRWHWQMAPISRLRWRRYFPRVYWRVIKSRKWAFGLLIEGMMRRDDRIFWTVRVQI